MTAATAVAINVQRGLLSRMPSKANPAAAKLTAVLRCIAGSPGEILTRKVEWTAHPISAVDPSKMAKAEDTAAMRLGHDDSGHNNPSQERETVAWAIEPFTSCYRPIKSNALGIGTAKVCLGPSNLP